MNGYGITQKVGPKIIRVGNADTHPTNYC